MIHKLSRLFGCHSRRESASALSSESPKTGCPTFATAPSSLRWAKRARSLTKTTLLLALVLPITLQAQQDDKPAPPKTGAELFQTSGCTHCHMMNGEGGTKGPNLSGVGRRMKPDAIKLQIQQGKGAMPPFQDALSDDEITALVHYLEKARSKK
jgi:mono/diheme cytochrome c family protein